jgi:hypothetical protein
VVKLRISIAKRSMGKLAVSCCNGALRWPVGRFLLWHWSKHWHHLWMSALCLGHQNRCLMLAAVLCTPWWPPSCLSVKQQWNCSLCTLSCRFDRYIRSLLWNTSSQQVLQSVKQQWKFALCRFDRYIRSLLWNTSSQQVLQSPAYKCCRQWNKWNFARCFLRDQHLHHDPSWTHTFS